MSIRYSQNSDVFIGRDENITDVRLNQSFNRLLDNDLNLSPTNTPEPRIWECRWFSDENVKGYDKGYAVWINTEDTEEFLDSKADDIYEYIHKHPYFTGVKEYNKRNEESYILYHSLLSGYVNQKNGTHLQPIYYLGDISQKAQIKVSLKDNNKDTPDTLSSWRDYFIRDTRWIEQELSAYGDYLFEQHVRELHFGDEYVDTGEYADNNLNNVSGINRYAQNKEGTELTGFDYVQNQYTKKENISVDVVEKKTYYTYGYSLSSFTYVLDQNQVHRDVNKLKEMMIGTRNYENDKIEIALEKLNYSNDLYFVNVQFSMVSANIKENTFPWVVSYDEWFQISDVIERYDTTFTLTSLTSRKIEETESDPKYYILEYNKFYYNDPQTDITPLTPKNEYYKIDEDLSSETISVYIGKEQHTILKGYNCWKSGYLEQFGFIECPPKTNTEVKLFVSYEYEEESRDAFYGFYTDMGGIYYKGDGNLGKDSRYDIQLTQIYNGDNNSDGTLEVNTILNDKFSIYNQSNATRYYMFTTRGYISRSL